MKVIAFLLLALPFALLGQNDDLTQWFFPEPSAQNPYHPTWDSTEFVSEYDYFIFQPDTGGHVQTFEDESPGSYIINTMPLSKASSSFLGPLTYDKFKSKSIRLASRHARRWSKRSDAAIVKRSRVYGRIINLQEQIQKQTDRANKLVEEFLQAEEQIRLLESVRIE